MRWAALSVLVAGCGPSGTGGPVGWPSLPGSVLVVGRAEPGSPPRAVLYDGAATADGLWLPNGGEATLFGFRETLENLQIGAGERPIPAPVAEAPCDEDQLRRLPAPVASFVPAVEGWLPAEATVPDSLRLPPLDVNRCFLDGGTPDERLQTCQPPIQPELPAPPAPPEEAQPPLGLPPDCADALVPSAGRCEPLSDPCPPDEFAEGIEGLYVSADSGGGGDGSRERPFGSVAEALRVGRRVHLGRGSHRISGRIEQAEIIGACAAETRLSGAIALSGVELSSVTVNDPIEAIGSVILRGVRAGATQVGAEARLRGERVMLGDLVADGPVVIDRAVLRSGRLSSDSVLSSATVLEGLELGAGAARLVAVRVQATLELAGGTLVGQDLAVGGLAATQGHSTTERLRVGRVLEEALIQGGTWRGVDVHVDAITVVVDRAVVELARVQLHEGEIRLRDAEADIEDLIATDAPDQTLDSARSQLRLRRVRASGGRRGLALRNGTQFEVEDVDLRDFSTAALRIGGAGSDILSVGDLTRARVRGPGELGLELRSVATRITDLAIEGTRAGVEVNRTATLEVPRYQLERVSLRGHEVALFVAGRPEGIEFRSVSIEEAATAARVGACLPEQGLLFSQMRPDRVGVALVFQIN